MALRTIGNRFFNFHLAYVKTLSTTTLQCRLGSTCPVEVSHLDHLVLTVKSVPDTINFYSSVLGMKVITFKTRFSNPITLQRHLFQQGDRKALGFGQQKINLHQVGQNLSPKPSVQLQALQISTPLPTVAAHLQVLSLCILNNPSEHFMVEKMVIERLTTGEMTSFHHRLVGSRLREGPVERSGAVGRISSLYFRDPDHNLIEVSIYMKTLTYLLLVSSGPDSDNKESRKTLTYLLLVSSGPDSDNKESRKTLTYLLLVSSGPDCDNKEVKKGFIPHTSHQRVYVCV
ncbi:Glyoxalase domain-containing protein 5 [Merluccius polli]|uniref:Glyoxalase domain-containing protein 5 n=1 Tax=Merluccius polli TaxID=89951 RepID=A0AA47N8V3_MERPO|nr:Glyoxalase domain-containing protein 5 [Merluccius polli]